MAVMSVLAVLGVLMFSSSGVLAQQATSADTPDPSAMRLVARATPTSETRHRLIQTTTMRV